MNIQEAKRLARAKMKEHGLLNQGWVFQFDNAKLRFGCCHYAPKKVISLSKPLTLLNTKDRVLDVILHEIAHALTQSGHDRKWKVACVEVGATPQRCYSDEVVQPKNARMERKWLAVCPNGHESGPRAKRMKISCSRCCNKFNPDYLFEWKLINKGVTL